MTKVREARAEMRIGLCRTVVFPWYDISLGRTTAEGEILRVRGVDSWGDPVFGDRSSEGSVYAHDFLSRTADPAPGDPEPLVDAEPDVEPDVELGACYQDPSDGEIVRVVSVEPLETSRIASGIAMYGEVYSAPDRPVSWPSGPASFRRVYTERVADPTPAIREPEGKAPVGDPLAEIVETYPSDHKPRGVKPAFALIPWEVMPEHLCPEVARESTDPERVISILFEIEGDAFLDDVARAFEHGAAKYGIDNWRGIEWTPRASLEYRSAMLRHLYADAIGERLDPDSGVSHRAHACASAMIHTYHERREAGEEGSR